MIVNRWQASVIPTKEQLMLMFKLEGLKPIEEVYPINSKVKEHRHPFDELRSVISGELVIDVSGNKLLLRAGDRIIIPANTKHSTMVENGGDCTSIYAHRIY